MTATPELLPCPFCNGIAELVVDTYGVYYVQCLFCECGTKYNPTEKDAVETWNRRTEEKG